MLAADKDELAELVERCTVFAKVTPQQKMAVVAALQAAGHIVGFLGDGNNDALALRKADVGVSVDSGASVSVPFKPWLRKGLKDLHMWFHLQWSSAKLCRNFSSARRRPLSVTDDTSILVCYDCNLNQCLR